MTKAQARLKPAAFDAARYLDDDEAIAEYLTAGLETNDPLVQRVWRRSPTDAGPVRVSEAIAPGAEPRYETVMKVARALGVKFTAQPARAAIVKTW